VANAISLNIRFGKFNLWSKLAIAKYP
jgi:hypothetical protein